NTNVGAAWVFTRTGSTWSQQGSKLVGTGAVGNAQEGISVAISADGNTAIVGGSNDNVSQGAAWVFTRSGGIWTQQGSKLVGAGAVGAARQGDSVALSSDGNTAIVGGSHDNATAGAAWVFIRSGGAWGQYGAKLVGTGAVGKAQQGFAVALSADGKTALVGGYLDNTNVGAAWAYLAPAELVAGGVAGWYTPSVPYKSGVGSPSSAPTVLDGNVNNTIFAYSYSNTGPVTATGFMTNEYIDG